MTTTLITGANRGIGLELCKQFSANQHKVIAVCRQPSPALQQLPVTIIDHIDLAQKHAPSTLAQQVSTTPIDLLIHNAGVWGGDPLGTCASDKTHHIFHINAVAPLLLTQHLLPNLHVGSKIIMITSRMGSIGDNTTGSRYSYRMSKAALNAAAKSLSIDLKDQGIIVGIIHPGVVATDMAGPEGICVTKAGTHIRDCIDQYHLDNTGVFMHAAGYILPW